jgi:Ca-activated chloride channel family protein
MWQSRAQALGCWPEAGPGCTWERIRDVAAHPGGWELVGRPEWRTLKLGYSYFGEGNSGTLGVVAMCLRGLGRTGGLRPADEAVGAGPPIAPANGANPEARLVTLEVPEERVIDRVGEVWREVKKHATVAPVVDKSGSMGWGGGGKIRAAASGAREFVAGMDAEDWLLWMPFDGTMYPGVEGRKADIGEELRSTIEGLSAGGGTALYDAVLLAHERLSQRRRAHGDVYRYGIVVLSDGRDEGSRRQLAALEEALRPSERDPAGIQIHTIAIGGDADERVLKRIAQAAHGRYWKGSAERDVVEAYRAIARHY